jgi:hypothetical protein
LCDKYGVERVGFLTLTFADHVLDPKEAQRRFNSLAGGVLNSRYVAWIRVFERQKSGRIHYHLLTVGAEDVRTGADFEAFERGDYRSANPALRREWAFWRGTAKAYGFGRTEFLPVKSTAEGIGKYVGKYIAKHIEARPESDKGVRLVSFSRGAGKASSNFAWASPRAWLWRAKLAGVAKLYGFSTMAHFQTVLGKAWAYKLAGMIVGFELPAQPGGVVYPTVAHAEADGHGSEHLPHDVTEVHVESLKPPQTSGKAPLSMPKPPSGIPAWIVERARLASLPDTSPHCIVEPPDPPYRAPSETRWRATLDAYGFVVAWETGVPTNAPF